MGFRDDIRFIVGGLRHGMGADMAMGLYDEAQQERDQKRQAMGALLADVGTRSLDPNIDPSRLSAYAQLMAPSLGLGPRGTNKALSRLSSSGLFSAPAGEAMLSPDEQAGFEKMVQPAISQWMRDPEYAESGPGGLPGRKDIRERALATFNPPPEQRAGFNEALNSAYLQNLSSPQFEAYQQLQQGEQPQVEGGGEGGFGLGDAATWGGLAAFGMRKPLLSEVPKLFGKVPIPGAGRLTKPGFLRAGYGAARGGLSKLSGLARGGGAAAEAVGAGAGTAEGTTARTVSNIAKNVGGRAAGVGAEAGSVGLGALSSIAAGAAALPLGIEAINRWKDVYAGTQEQQQAEQDNLQSSYHLLNQLADSARQGAVDPQRYLTTLQNLTQDQQGLSQEELDELWRFGMQKYQSEVRPALSMLGS